jgi:outer membrane receptor protein involved in Fe transport
MRPYLLFSALVLAPALAGAQRTPPDSARADTALRLQAVSVTVTRTEAQALVAPWAIGVQSARDVRRAQPTLTTDEALNSVPGVMVSNRYIYALDPRVSVRGAGSRANFGTRGVKVLLDGVPQSLPDGQSQLTNVELGTIGRVEVLRGAASSLYGNGSGGVISFETDRRAPSRLAHELRVTSGAYAPSLGNARLTDRAFTKWQTRLIERGERYTGTLSLSRTTVSGFRQHSDADVRNINGGPGASASRIGAARAQSRRPHQGRMGCESRFGRRGEHSARCIAPDHAESGLGGLEAHGVVGRRASCDGVLSGALGGQSTRDAPARTGRSHEWHHRGH